MTIVLDEPTTGTERHGLATDDERALLAWADAHPIAAVRPTGGPGPQRPSERGLTAPGLLGAAREAGVPMVGDCEGGMFGFFFADSLPQNYPAVIATDKERFNAFFHAMLESGVYFAPALYEAGFVSAAHTDADIATTIAAAAEALATA